MDVVHILYLVGQSLIEKNAFIKSMSQGHPLESMLIVSNKYTIPSTANSVGLLGKNCSNPLSSAMIPPVLVGAKLVH